MKHPILHVDANAFYCSCHQAEDPSLRGKPICVGGKQQEGSIRTPILVTASYEARRIHPGVRAGQTVPEAKRLVPELLVLQPDFALYRSYSKRLFDLLNRFSPLVEQVSIDEGYLDLTGVSQFGDPAEAAYLIKETVKSEIGIPVSVGVADNKLLAKMASNMYKPDKVTVLDRADVPTKLWPLSVRELHGCGNQTASRLERLQVKTIGDLALKEKEWLVSRFGKALGTYLYDSSKGNGPQTVNPFEYEKVKSISHSTTLPLDIDDFGELRRYLLAIAEEAASRLRQQSFVSRTVTLTIRDWKRSNLNRSRTLSTPTGDGGVIFQTLLQLFEQSWTGQPVRLLGVSLSHLSSESEQLIEQLSLFDGSGPHFSQPTASASEASTPTECIPPGPSTATKRKKLIQTLDQLQSKYGQNSITRASLLPTRSDSVPKPDGDLST